jgi:alpha-beta hydrolase superfamily lysophospholipase
VTVALCAAGAATMPAGVAGAATNPYERGPAPTDASIEAAQGPYAVSRTTVSGVPGFGPGTIYFPTSTEDGTFGAVIIVPGFLAFQPSVSWLGPRLASQGFVVMTIDTNTILDFPGPRADELLAAADYLTGSSSVRTRVDGSRVAVAGWSMGGGGALEAAAKRPSLKATIPLSGWDTNTTFSSVRVPGLVIGAEHDAVAPVAFHSEPFYRSLGGEKAYLELNNADHFTVTSPNVTVATYMISWLKRWVDDDTRYTRFLCPGPSTGDAIQQYVATCPF